MVSVLVSFRVVQRRSRPECGIAPPAPRTAMKARVHATVALKSGRSAVRPRPCPRANFCYSPHRRAASRQPEPHAVPTAPGSGGTLEPFATLGGDPALAGRDPVP